MLTTLMHRFWQRAPRRLRTTRAGRVLVLIALGAGLAALNTGNNLLFFGWGMVLSAIVVSGVLSEATLRYLSCAEVSQQAMRARMPGAIAVRLHNGSQRMPAFGLDAAVRVWGPDAASDAAHTARAPYVLRLAPKGALELRAPFTPDARGAYRVAGWEVTTAYPFGFFEKSRRIPGGLSVLWAAPRVVAVGSLVDKLTSHWGEMPAGRQGAGEDYFALRPFRDGDDWRRINWRRSARTGRLVLVEHEAVAGQEVLLELRVDTTADPDAQEMAIATLASLAEALLEAGMGVGIYTQGVSLSSGRGPRQVQAILAALARLSPEAPLPKKAPWQTTCVSVVLTGAGAQKAAATTTSVLLPMQTERTAA